MLRGVGFRLGAEIIPVESDSPPEPRHWLDWRMAVPALVLLIGLLVWWQSEPITPRVALLGVDNATGDYLRRLHEATTWVPKNTTHAPESSGNGSNARQRHGRVLAGRNR